MVELLGSGRRLARRVQHLPVANLMHGFDSRQDNASTAKGFEAQHGPGDALDESMMPEAYDLVGDAGFSTLQAGLRPASGSIDNACARLFHRGMH